MRRHIKVLETTEIVTILSGDEEGIYRIIWHRAGGMPEEEFHVKPGEDETVEEAVAEDLKDRLGP